MTFDNGVNTRNSTAAEITEQSIRLIIQGVITLAVLGGWIYTTVTGNPAAGTFQPAVLAVIAFWFGQSVAYTWLSAKHVDQQVKLAQTQAHVQEVQAQASSTGPLANQTEKKEVTA